MTYRFDPEQEARDEAFWQAQERRKKGLLGQPCCTQSKTSWALMDVPGRLAVVVHGEFDCLNCFHHHLGRNAHNFYSSRLTDHQITTGQTQEPLRHLLRLLVAERRPDAVVVLGTCPVEVIGDRFEVVVDAVSAESGVPMVAMRTSGLAMTKLTDCQDWLYANLAGLPQIEAVDRVWVEAASALARDLLLDDSEITPDETRALHARATGLAAPGQVGPEQRVNLVGMPDLGQRAHEPARLLPEVGLAVNGLFPHGATLDDWRSVSRARASFVVDGPTYPRLIASFAAYGQEVVDVALPIGLGRTLALYGAIGRVFEKEQAIEALLASRVDRARARVEAFRTRYGGARVAMAIRMLNTYRMDQVAEDGLGDLAQVTELGLEPTLLVQGPPEEAPRFLESLRARGVTCPAKVFPGPWELGEFLAEGGYDGCIIPDSSRNTARRAGLPMISARSLQPYLMGLDENMEALAGLVEAGRRSRRSA